MRWCGDRAGEGTKGARRSALSVKVVLSGLTNGLRSVCGIKAASGGKKRESRERARVGKRAVHARRRVRKCVMGASRGPPILNVVERTLCSAARKRCSCMIHCNFRFVEEGVT